MNPPHTPDNGAVNASVRIYARLLVLYPASFRREYGEPMKQVFRDQCREARNKSGGWGLALVWMRALMDLARTMVLEHISNLRDRGGLFGEVAKGLRSEAPGRLAFLRVFKWTATAALAWSFLLMACAPRIYSSRVIVRASSPRQDPYFLRIQPKIIESYRLLTNVIVNLRLDEKLAEPAKRPRLTVDETYNRLISLMTVKRLRVTGLLEISISSADPTLAALIANAIAERYHQLENELETHGQIGAEVTILNPARPPNSPDSPNYRAFVIWLMEGTSLAMLGGFMAAMIALRKRPASV